VDGDAGEWDLAVTGDDWIDDMHIQGDPTKTLYARAYARYNCTTGTLYVLVHVPVDGSGDALQYVSNAETWVRIYGIATSTLGEVAIISATEPTTDVENPILGYEWSFPVARECLGRSQFHVQRITEPGSGGDTISTGKQGTGSSVDNWIYLDLRCPCTVDTDCATQDTCVAGRCGMDGFCDYEQEDNCGCSDVQTCPIPPDPCKIVTCVDNGCIVTDNPSSECDQSSCVVDDDCFVGTSCDDPDSVCDTCANGVCSEAGSCSFTPKSIAENQACGGAVPADLEANECFSGRFCVGTGCQDIYHQVGYSCTPDVPGDKSAGCLVGKCAEDETMVMVCMVRVYKDSVTYINDTDTLTLPTFLPTSSGRRQARIYTLQR
jgi:hypothetical protein